MWKIQDHKSIKMVGAEEVRESNLNYKLCEDIFILHVTVHIIIINITARVSVTSRLVWNVSVITAITAQFQLIKK